MVKAFLGSYLGKIALAIVVMLFGSTVYLTVENKVKTAQLTVVRDKLAEQQQVNQLLGEQLQQANLRITDYLTQTKALQANVNRLQQEKQEKDDEIAEILETHKNWADRPVPDDVSRLFQQAARRSQPNTATLPDGKSVPHTQGAD